MVWNMLSLPTACSTTWALRVTMLRAMTRATTGTELDPITLEILWSRLISIADESAAALLRTSFSTIVRESNDYATVLMDANGDALAENTAGIPSFVGILPRTLRDHLLVRYPRE